MPREISTWTFEACRPDPLDGCQPLVARWVILIERTPGAVAEGTRKGEGDLKSKMDRDQIGQFHGSRDLILLIRVGRAFDHLARHYADPTQPIQEGLGY